MSIEIKGKNVWITGASSGIGAALAKALHKEGANLIISARRTELLEKLALELPGSHVLPLDLTATESLTEKAASAISHFGSIDIMIHNGGLSQRTTACNTPPENTRKIMETNFFGTVALTTALLPHMQARKSGRFVVISSLMGKFGAPGRSSYAASKHALHGYFDALRAEEWYNGIRVTLVVPGYINTDFSVNALTANGNAHGKKDQGQANGMSAQVCANKIIAAIKSDREEALIGGIEISGALAKRWIPGILSRILRGKNID